jgi:hypothetical protein
MTIQIDWALIELDVPTDSVLIEPEMALILFGGLFTLAVFGVVLSFKLTELNWGFGVLGSIAIGIALLVGIWDFGAYYWNPSSAAAFEQGVFIGLAGLISGFALAVTMFEPETDTQESTEKSYFSSSGKSSSKQTGIPGGLEDLDNKED